MNDTRQNEPPGKGNTEGAVPSDFSSRLVTQLRPPSAWQDFTDTTWGGAKISWNSITIKWDAAFLLQSANKYLRNAVASVELIEKVCSRLDVLADAARNPGLQILETRGLGILVLEPGTPANRSLTLALQTIYQALPLDLQMTVGNFDEYQLGTMAAYAARIPKLCFEQGQNVVSNGLSNISLDGVAKVTTLVSQMIPWEVYVTYAVVSAKGAKRRSSDFRELIPGIVAVLAREAEGWRPGNKAFEDLFRVPGWAASRAIRQVAVGKVPLDRQATPAIQDQPSTYELLIAEETASEAVKVIAEIKSFPDLRLSDIRVIEAIETLIEQGYGSEQAGSSRELERFLQKPEASIRDSLKRIQRLIRYKTQI